jgi:hypothetical protein
MLMRLLAALIFKMPGRQVFLQAQVWLVALSLLMPSIISAHETISSFSEVQYILDSLGPDDLVVFDVDDVLIMQEDAILQKEHSDTLHALLYKHLVALDEKTQEKIISLLYMDAKRCLIEPNVLHLITSLHERQIKTIALTATRIGSFSDVGSIQDWRIHDLQTLGIQFDQSFNQFPFFVLDEIHSDAPSPVFKSGILFSALYAKGKVLEAFLKKVSFTPKTVVFFDDRIENVYSVFHEMKNMGIDHVYSFHYTHKNIETLDPYIANMQITYLIQHGQWLSDAAQNFLQ